ncbi:MAG: glycosyltransferase 87 family protein [Rhodoglobus sp.]
MTDVRPPQPGASAILFAIVRSPITVWAAFVLVHLWLGLLNLYAPGLPFGDVTYVYKFWTDQALVAHFWVGIDSVWVYPIVALVPMLGAAVFGPDQYGSTWLSMVMLLNAVAFGFLTGWGRSRERVGVAWWWIGFLVLLGPIALGRIDSVSVPLALVGVILVARRPKVAALLITLATWIKVWPAALLLAAIIALKDRWRIATTAIASSIAIVAVAVALGSGSNVFSFITQQTGRGLQPESPVGSFFVWEALAGLPGAGIYYDQSILSYGVRGPGDVVAIALTTPLLALAVFAIAFLGIRAQRAGAVSGDLFPPLALALTTAFLAFNKVGSPQYIAWLAVPIVLGIVTRVAGHGRSFRTPAILGLVIAALTQVIYPYLYDWLLALNPLLVSALTVRNVLEFVLLGWAVHAVIRSPLADVATSDEPGSLSVWPLRAESVRSY